MIYDYDYVSRYLYVCPSKQPSNFKQLKALRDVLPSNVSHSGQVCIALAIFGLLFRILVSSPSPDHQTLVVVVSARVVQCAHFSLGYLKRFIN